MALDLHMKNGFQAISFEYVGVFDSYFIHRYIIIKYMSSLIMDKIHQLSSELWPICERDSYFIHRYIIIKYRSSLNTDKINQLLSEL